MQIQWEEQNVFGYLSLGGGLLFFYSRGSVILLVNATCPTFSAWYSRDYCQTVQVQGERARCFNLVMLWFVWSIKVMSDRAHNMTRRNKIVASLRSDIAILCESCRVGPFLPRLNKFNLAGEPSTKSHCSANHRAAFTGQNAESSTNTRTRPHIMHA